MSKFCFYLDLDGVKADYETGIIDFGFPPDPSLNKSAMLLSGTQNAEKRKRYEAIKGTEFYRVLKMYKDSEKIWNAVREYDPIILTAAPKFDATEDDYYLDPNWLGAAYHKRHWVEHVMLPEAEYSRQPWWIKLLRQLFYSGQTRPVRIPIPDDRFICTTSKRKHEFMHRKKAEFQILIDDRPDNCRAWREAGGIAIQHVTVDTTLEEIAEIIEKYS